MYVFIMLQLKIHNIWIEFFKMKDFSLQAWIIEILTTAKSLTSEWDFFKIKNFYLCAGMNNRNFNPKVI